MMVKARTDSVRIIRVIETKAIRGLGIEKDPAREAAQYWGFYGKFLAEMDTEYCMPIIEHEIKTVKESILLDS